MRMKHDLMNGWFRKDNIFVVANKLK